ncbi:hypothetical protein F4680DRAFT_438528 [Xylaria scruposa]|nr:hypothetical protein F4680DRAFT_438528 [Xylaria scruposa]
MKITQGSVRSLLPTSLSYFFPAVNDYNCYTEKAHSPSQGVISSYFPLHLSLFFACHILSYLPKYLVMHRVALSKRQSYDRSPGHSQQSTPRAKSPDSGYGSESSGRLKRWLGRRIRSPFSKGNRSSAPSSAPSIAESSNADAVEPQDSTSLCAELTAASGHATPANNSTPLGDGNAADSSHPASYGGIYNSDNPSDYSFPRPSRQEEEQQRQSQGYYTLPRHQPGLNNAEFNSNEHSGGGDQIVGSLVQSNSSLGLVTNNHLYRENVLTRKGRGHQFIGQCIVGGNAAIPFSGRFIGNKNYGPGSQVVGVGFN